MPTERLPVGTTVGMNGKCHQHFQSAYDDGVVALEEAEISLDGFAYDTSVLPDEVESVLLVETIQETIEDLILDQMETLLAATIESALSELDTSVTVTLMAMMKFVLCKNH